jgi:hypothetical protein
MNLLFVQDFAVQELVCGRPVKTMTCKEQLKIVDADNVSLKSEPRFSLSSCMTKDEGFLVGGFKAL